ncbi:MAG: YibE/F family protein [Acidimicrobiia bacterium]
MPDAHPPAPHGHSHGGHDLAIASYMRVVVAVIAVATVIGLVLLWPRGEAPDLAASTSGIDLVDATITGIDTQDCVDPLEGAPTQCRVVSVDLTSGPTAGEPGTFLSSLIDFSQPEFEVGEKVVLSYNELAPPEFQYSFAEYQRRSPLVLLALVFAAVVIGFGRWKGVRALAGLAVSLAVLLVFMLPSILRANNAIAVALVATSAIAFAALYLAHGVSPFTTVALVGTLLSVVFITFVAWLAAGAASLTGLSDGSLQILRVTAEAVDPRAILIAGIVVGALGVLDDVTVTQVSAVAELRDANPGMTRRQVYGAAIRIGRDHITSTVNTLVLAYAGASMALLLYFFQEGRSIGQVLNREVVAVEVIRTLVGSIGLVLSVPITTALAVAISQPAGTSHPSREERRHPTPVERSAPSPASWDDFGPVGNDVR